MPKFDVELRAFINVTVEAEDRSQAIKRAEKFVGWLDPTQEFIMDYNGDHEGQEIDTATINLNGVRLVELDGKVVSR